ncbi:hypothetical protein CBM2634_A230092 [Cupriavidus taiwanensis]|uniref:Uncharacterized protein n=1 Tax=Cupriavidus taiwanensis TaxID=164546 RepID=A0A375J048_9BURK|nr:hypothetical protein CBM2634_A230092 [Cupriavidus taiwanensis]
MGCDGYREAWGETRGDRRLFQKRNDGNSGNLRRRPHILAPINTGNGTICMDAGRQLMPQDPHHGKTLVTIRKHSVTLNLSCNKLWFGAIHKIKGLAQLARKSLVSLLQDERRATAADGGARGELRLFGSRATLAALHGSKGTGKSTRFRAFATGVARGQRQVDPWTHATDAFVSASDESRSTVVLFRRGRFLAGRQGTPAAPHFTFQFKQRALPCGAPSKVLVSFAS